MYVSNDENASTFEDYYVYSMPFAAVPYSNTPLRMSLKERYRIVDIPSLVFMDRLGNILQVDGRKTVSSWVSWVVSSVVSSVVSNSLFFLRSSSFFFLLSFFFLFPFFFSPFFPLLLPSSFLFRHQQRQCHCIERPRRRQIVDRRPRERECHSPPVFPVFSLALLRQWHAAAITFTPTQSPFSPPPTPPTPPTPPRSSSTVDTHEHS